MTLVTPSNLSWKCSSRAANHGNERTIRRGSLRSRRTKEKRSYLSFAQQLETRPLGVVIDASRGR